MNVLTEKDLTSRDVEQLNQLLQGYPCEDADISDAVQPLWVALEELPAEDRSMKLGELLAKNPDSDRIISTIFSGVKEDSGMPQDASIAHLIPKTGFIRTYYDYACLQTDAPDRFHLFGAWSVVSTLLQRKIGLMYGSYSVYPNLYLAIVAGSSTFHKSAALEIAQGIIETFEMGDTGEPGAIIYPVGFSKERICAIMAKQSQGVFLLDELGDFIQSMDKNYMHGVKGMFTKLYGCPRKHAESFQKGEVVIRDSCPGIFGASTIDWLLPNLKEEGLKGGFYYRFLYMPARTIGTLLPEPAQYNEGARRNVANAATSIWTLESGRIVTHEVKHIYYPWFHKFMAMKTEHAYLDNFKSRYQIVVWKLAMIYEAASAKGFRKNANGDYILSEESVHMGITAVEFLFAEMQRLFLEEVSFSTWGAQKNVVLKVIREAARGRISRTNLMRKCKSFSGRTVTEIIADLVECGSIETITEQNKSGKGRPAELYCYKQW